MRKCLSSRWRILLILDYSIILPTFMNNSRLHFFGHLRRMVSASWSFHRSCRVFAGGENGSSNSFRCLFWAVGFTLIIFVILRPEEVSPWNARIQCLIHLYHQARFWAWRKWTTYVLLHCLKLLRFWPCLSKPYRSFSFSWHTYFRSLFQRQRFFFPAFLMKDLLCSKYQHRLFEMWMSTCGAAGSSWNCYDTSSYHHKILLRTHRQ